MDRVREKVRALGERLGRNVKVLCREEATASSGHSNGDGADRAPGPRRPSSRSSTRVFA